MQLFALFMLCGTFVSLLIPETKGQTLEELAGEAPTSYNAGRNGSIAPPTKPWWNPFGGGQPAGFFYPKAGSWGRNQRVGIMTSPEIAVQQAQEMRKATKTWRRKRGSSEDTGDYEFESASSTTGIVGPSNMRQDGEANAGGKGGVFPGWGAGWGRIDRGGNPTSVENIGLRDVGNLLR